MQWTAPATGIAMCQSAVSFSSARKEPSNGRSYHVDLAKIVFQVQNVDATGAIVIRRQLRRSQVLPFFRKLPPCLVGAEACASGHHWAREISALGHEVRLMPARYVKPYVKRNKNDAADTEAICEAVTRPSMRFVPIKTPGQQSVLMLHRTRRLFVRQRVMLVNALRAHLAEFGIVAGVGRNGLEKLLEAIADEQDERVPEPARGHNVDNYPLRTSQTAWKTQFGTPPLGAAIGPAPTHRQCKTDVLHGCGVIQQTRQPPQGQRA